MENEINNKNPENKKGNNGKTKEFCQEKLSTGQKIR